MSASISKISSMINKRGIAKSNRFIVMVPPVRGINIFGNSAMNAIISQIGAQLPGAGSLGGTALICSSATLPGRSFMAGDKKEYPQKIENIPYTDAPSEMPLRFITGRDMFEYFFFEQWANDVMDRETNLFNYYDDYTVSIIISQLDEDDNVIAAVELEGCYPKAISPIQMAFEQNNQAVQLEVTMAYKKYRPILTPYSLSMSVLGILNKVTAGVGDIVSGSLGNVNPLSKISIL